MAVPKVAISAEEVVTEAIEAVLASALVKGKVMALNSSVRLNITAHSSPKKIGAVTVNTQDQVDRGVRVEGF